MSDDILSTIEVLSGRVVAKEEEANKLKRLVNELCEEVGVPIRYANISAPETGLAKLRSDQFYGLTITAAIRGYLERRKAADLGAASAQEIYKAVRDGGYKFDTKNEENAKISVSNALRKSSSIFHRLPNGNYGLLSWYPLAKAQPEAGNQKKQNGDYKQSSHKLAARESTSNHNTVTNKEIRDVILAQEGEFHTSDIEVAVMAKYPSKELRKTKVPQVLFVLKTDKGVLTEVSPRIGKNQAVYRKA